MLRPATLRTGNVIICYLPQQRTRGCTKLPFLVTAAKQICQHCFLLPAFSQIYPDRTQGKEPRSSSGKRPEGMPHRCLQVEAQRCPRPKTKHTDSFAHSQGAGLTVTQVCDSTTINSLQIPRGVTNQGKAPGSLCGGSASGGPRCHTLLWMVGSKGFNPFPSVGGNLVNGLGTQLASWHQISPSFGLSNMSLALFTPQRVCEQSSKLSCK